MSTRRIGVVVSSLLLCLLAGKAWAGISISPGFLQVRLDKGRQSGEFVIANTGDIEERYRIRATHFILRPDGGLLRVDPDAHSLAPWVIFSPREFVMAPKTRRVVRYVITPRGSLRPGDYWGGMELESLNVTNTEGKDAAGRGIKLKIIPTIMVPMFGQVGEVSRIGVIRSAMLEQGAKGSQVKVMLSNTGTGRISLSGLYEISDANGNVVARGPIGNSFVFPGADRIFDTPLEKPIPDGRYRLKVQYTAIEFKEALTKEVDFDWKAPPPVAVKPSAGPAAGSAPGSAPAPAPAPVAGSAAAPASASASHSGSAASSTP